MKTLSLFILFSFLTTFCVRSQELAYSFSESYDVTQPTSLKISSSNSNIAVFSHNRNSIEIQYSVKKNGKLLSVNKSTLRAIIKNQSNLIVNNTQDRLNIEVSNINKAGYIKSKDAVIIDFIVYVPIQTSCDLVSSDGNISLNGLNSKQKCITSDGNIKLSNLNGNVIAKTSDGDIIIENVTGNVDGQTMDGQIIKTEE